MSKQRHLVLLRAQLLCLCNPVGKRGMETQQPLPLLQLSTPAKGELTREIILLLFIGVLVKNRISFCRLLAWWCLPSESGGGGKMNPGPFDCVKPGKSNENVLNVAKCFAWLAFLRHP